ncbi:MAG: ATP-binding protein [Syntrophobacteraceae bacterium]|nr:ATP-binding protein [Syntrophobacteraceae bacterium]
MREVVVISGKGGTGKTSLTGAFAHLASNKIVCDLDVDAPDLHLLLRPQAGRTEEFFSGHVAQIDNRQCTGCGLCASMCRYDAVRVDGNTYSIDPLRCEGCRVCVAFCPAGAVLFPEKHCGHWHISSTRFGRLVHARLFPGEANSGRLVSVLKQQARQLAKSEGKELILSDGAPGIGCPVISSLSGADLAVAVTEPTPSGRHDLERVAELCGHFRIRLGVIINKFDLNPEGADGIEEFCRSKGHEVIARLAHDQIVTKAMVAGLVVTELPETDFTREVRKTWARIEELAARGKKS